MLKTLQSYSDFIFSVVEKITFQGEKCDQSQQIETYLQRAIAECVAHPKVPTPNF